MLTHRENYCRSVRFETPAYVHSGVGVLTAAWHRHGQALSDLLVRMFLPLKEAGLPIYFHSDGYIMDIVPDLKDAGVDVLNPQTNCQSIEALDDVRAYFDRVAQGIGGPDGGLMFQVEIGPDTPLANAAAALESVKRYGTPQGRP